MNPTALITGASEGFGLALCRCLAKNGYDLAIIARRGDRLDAVAAELRQQFPDRDIFAYAADVTNESQVIHMAEAVCEHFGRLDLLVNAVGVSDRGRAVEINAADFSRLLQVNVYAAILCTREFLPLLQESKGQIINIGSLASKFAARWLGGYCLAKHALAGWTQQLRLELAPQGVHVMLVCPGPIQRADNAPRYAQQTSGLPEVANRPAGGAKLKGLNPDRLAESVYRALRKKKVELIVPRHVRSLAVLCAMWPSFGEWVLLQMTGGVTKTSPP